MRKIPTDTWILIADWAEARLLTNAGSDYRPALKQVKHLKPENLIDDGPAGHPARLRKTSRPPTRPPLPSNCSTA